MLKSSYQRESAQFVPVRVGRGPAAFDRGASAPEWSGCSRCGGLMVRSFLSEAHGRLADGLAPCSRCINCGELVDAQVLANRMARRSQPNR